MVTIDPDNGMTHEKMEPLKELKKYRLASGADRDRFKDSPLFGVQMRLLRSGRVAVGDQVWIEYKPNTFD